MFASRSLRSVPLLYYTGTCFLDAASIRKLRCTGRIDRSVSAETTPQSDARHQQLVLKYKIPKSCGETNRFSSCMTKSARKEEFCGTPPRRHRSLL